LIVPVFLVEFCLALCATVMLIFDFLGVSVIGSFK